MLYKPTRDEARTLMGLKAGTTKEVDDPKTGKVTLERVPEEPIPPYLLDILEKYEVMVRKRSNASGMPIQLLTAVIVLAQAMQKENVLSGETEPMPKVFVKPLAAVPDPAIAEGDTINVTVKGKALSGTYLGRDGGNLIVSIDGKVTKVPAADAKGVVAGAK